MHEWTNIPLGEVLINGVSDAHLQPPTEYEQRNYKNAIVTVAPVKVTILWYLT